MRGEPATGRTIRDEGERAIGPPVAHEARAEIDDLDRVAGLVARAA